jgi:hypothetical protein
VQIFDSDIGKQLLRGDAPGNEKRSPWHATGFFFALTGLNLPSASNIRRGKSRDAAWLICHQNQRILWMRCSASCTLLRLLNALRRK